MQMIKKMALFFGLIMIWTSAYAQQFTPPNTVHLKDGSFLKGIIVTETEEQIELQLADGSTIQLSKENIEKVEVPDVNLHYFPNGKRIRTKGIYKVFTIGALVGKDPNFDELKIGAHLIHGIVGYQFTPHLAIGGGLGMDFYDNEYIPFYLDVRGQINKKAISPYYALNFGYAFALSGNDFTQHNGGWMVHPSIGLRFATKEKVSFLVEFGYKIQKAEIEYSGSEIVDKWTYRRMALKVGVQF